MTTAPVVFTRPYRSARELPYLTEVLESGHVHGDGRFTGRASALLADILGHDRVLLTASGTDALDMCTLLLGIQPGDEVIMPSYTFASAATSVASYGGVPVFVDNDIATGNLDPDEVEKAITPRTRAISVMHYGGVGADMTRIGAIAESHDLPVIEDNAHGLGAQLGGRTLGTIGALGVQSFHDTKNVHSGEGGALVVNRADLAERAAIIREKGTDRSKFNQGKDDRYTLVDIGSSFLMSELSAAVLTAQLESFDHIRTERHRIWDRYGEALRGWATEESVALMGSPADTAHPAHMFFLLMPDAATQRGLIAALRAEGITATFHYQPLHDSPGGRRLGRTPGSCERASAFASRIVRLPLWPDLTAEQVERVTIAVTAFRTSTVR